MGSSFKAVTQALKGGGAQARLEWGTPSIGPPGRLGSDGASQGAVSRRGWIRAGADPSNEVGAQPNKRLELAAPLVVELHL